MSCLWQNFFNRIIFYWELTCKLDDRMHCSCVVLTLPFAQTLHFFQWKMMFEFWTKKRYCKQREILYLLVVIFINKHNISSSGLVGVDPSFCPLGKWCPTLPSVIFCYLFMILLSFSELFLSSFRWPTATLLVNTFGFLLEIPWGTF